MKDERSALLARPGLVGAALRSALVTLYDEWLAGLLGDAGPGVALVAVGGLGRREPAPGSDLDLVLVHDGRSDPGDLAALADRLWYPIWDSGVGLDHSVRTVAEAVTVARGDLKAALGLLDARHVAGDPVLSAELLSAARAAWRSGASRRLPELRAAVEERARSAGEVAFLLEPDLKEGRGGLRDVHALQAVAAAQVADPPAAAVVDAHTVLLDVRGELHRRTAGPGRSAPDRLLMQEQDGVAAALGLADADALMAAVSAAARTIAYAGDTTWRRVTSTRSEAPTVRRRVFGRSPSAPVRQPLADGVVEQAGEVVLARDASPETDPVLVLRVAEAAARAELPISPQALRRLVAAPDLPTPWPAHALARFVGLLAAGPGTVAVVEALDQAGLMSRLLPEWEHVRSKPQRNSYHRFTVDRHLVEAVVAAAALTRTVDRPDLLLLGALLHDIGKGLPGDHTEVGIDQVKVIGPRLGLSAEDTAVLVALVRHHLLLPDVATRRDLADPATTTGVAEAVGSAGVLQLLHALTQADSAATGPAAWSPWKAGLVAELVGRSAALLAGRPLPADPPLDQRTQELVARGALALEADGEQVTLVAPDRPGLLSAAAGVFALHQLDVRAASVRTPGVTAVLQFQVSPRFGSMPDLAVVRDDLRHALAGDLPLAERLAGREAAYPRRSPVPLAPPAVRLLDDVSDTATVVEVRAADAVGVLHRVTAALDGCALDVRSAHVSTLGADVVDTFYVVGVDGAKLTDPGLRTAVADRVLAALS